MIMIRHAMDEFLGMMMWMGCTDNWCAVLLLLVADGLKVNNCLNTSILLKICSCTSLLH